MADTSEAQLAKLEAEHKKRMDALKEVVRLPPKSGVLSS